MDTNDDFYGKELNLNCFYMHTNFEQKYPKTAIVICMDTKRKESAFSFHAKQQCL
jgi:hydrogenase maturation factor